MKLRSLAITAIVMFAACVWAQSTPPSGAQGQTGAGTTKSTQKTPSGKGMGGGQMGAMHQQHMQEMQASITKMQALLNSMRSNVSSMDPKDQPAMTNNIELWQMLIDHMNQMVQRMGSMGPGMMQGPQGGAMHHHGAMGTMKEGTPSSGTTKPTTPPPPPPPPPPQ